MASPVIESTTNYNENSSLTTHPVSFPSGIANGDLLIALFNTQNVTITFPAAWVLMNEVNGSGIAKAVYYLDANGTESGTFDVVLGSGASAMAFVYRISGAEPPGTQVPEISINIGNFISPNPPNLIPTGGSKDYLWLASMMKTATGSLTATPANYTNLLNVSSGGKRAASMRRFLTATSENPGIYTSSGAAQSSGSTIAVHPASECCCCGPVDFVNISGAIFGGII